MLFHKTPSGAGCPRRLRMKIVTWEFRSIRALGRFATCANSCANTSQPGKWLDPRRKRTANIREAEYTVSCKLIANHLRRSRPEVQAICAKQIPGPTVRLYCRLLHSAEPSRREVSGNSSHDYSQRFVKKYRAQAKTIFRSISIASITASFACVAEFTLAARASSTQDHNAFSGAWISCAIMR